MVGFNWAPNQWALCYGQQMSLNQYTALYSLLGSQFGGDDRTYFNLPDLRGRSPIGQGQGPGLTNRIFGKMSGSETAQLTVLNMPVHNHTATVTDPVYSGTGSVTPNAFSGRGGTASNDPISNFPAPAPTGTNIYNSTSSGVMGSSPVTVTVSKTTAGTVTIGNNGGGQPFSIMQPLTCVNFIIALEGIYPSRP
ncbi:MAG: hypothetical protein A2068_11145 [Ignavibacteria bacterium GWB2_35_6b]|nr:MAG: hypothetical protein A2068_11145 [Ignavibacteria bacterium GWB2_35_6b]